MQLWDCHIFDLEISRVIGFPRVGIAKQQLREHDARGPDANAGLVSLPHEPPKFQTLGISGIPGSKRINPRFKTPIQDTTQPCESWS